MILAGSAVLAVSWAISLMSAAFMLLSTAAILAHRSRPGTGWSEPPGVTLLKPLCGMEEGLDTAIESFLAQEVAGRVRFVFGVADAHDPGLAVARRVAARYPGCDVDFVIDPTLHGPNPKVSNLINMARGGLGEVVVISDSDVLIPAGSLQALLDGLARPGVGAVTALYRGKPTKPGNRVQAFGAWFINGWFLPIAVLHARLAPLAVTYGPLTAIRGDLLEEVGGFEALVDTLSDDAELGRLIRRHGYSIDFASVVVDTLVNDGSLPELFNHELRWARTVRGLDPLGYVASIVTQPGPLPLLAVLERPSPASVGLMLAIVALRWVLASAAAWKFDCAACVLGPDAVSIWLRDQLCFAVWAAALVVNRVSWRGHSLPLGRRATLQPAMPRPEQLA